MLESLLLELIHLLLPPLLNGLQRDHDLGRLLVVLLHRVSVLSRQFVQIRVLGKTRQTRRLRVIRIAEHLLSDFELLKPLLNIKHYKLQGLDPQI